MRNIVAECRTVAPLHVYITCLFLTGYVAVWKLTNFDTIQVSVGRTVFPQMVLSSVMQQ